MRFWTRRQFLQGGLGWALASRLSAASLRCLRLAHWSDLHWGSQDEQQSACVEAWTKGLEIRPDALLMTGDHADNGSGRGDFAERFQSVWGRLSERLQGFSGPLFLTLGNSDFRNNYQSDPETLRETYQLSCQALGERYYLDELGNGVRLWSGLQWLSLNSQIFSPKNRYAGAAHQAEQSLGWMKQQLQQAPGSSVLLLHIPPCDDLYLGASAWRVEHRREFWRILNDLDRPCWIVSGHFHRNEVHAGRPAAPVPLLVAGSLSRKYEYAPNWRSWSWEVGPLGLQKCTYALHYPGQPSWESRYDLSDLRQFRRKLDQLEFLQRYQSDLFAHHELGRRAEPWPLQEQFWAD